MTPLASFSGLATGLDTASIVRELVRAESLPIRRLESKKLNIDSMSRRMQTIRERLDAVKTAGEGIAGATTGRITTALSSSDEAAISATSSGETATGTYRLEVSQLAQAERTYSTAFDDRSGGAGGLSAGSFTVQAGADAAVSIDVLAGDTLDSIAQKINDSDADVSAAVIFDGAQYRLQVSGNESGTSAGIGFTETGTNLGLTDPANEIVAAQDALFTVDGLAMSRPTNAVVDAIPGVSLSLHRTTTDPVTIQVNRDLESTQTQVQTFLDAFNEVLTGINSEFVYSGAARTGDSLAGDSTLRGIQSALSSNVTSPATGASGAYTTFASIGISVTQSGTLELDAEAFTAAIDADENGVIALLHGDEAAGVTGLLERLNDTVDSYTDPSEGLLSSRIDSYSDQKDSIDDRISSMEIRIDKFEVTLRQKFASMETLVAGMQAQGQQMMAMLAGLG